MKKILNTILIALILICVLSACGKKQTSDSFYIDSDKQDLSQEIIGEWSILKEKSAGADIKNYYPEESTLVFSKDGTWNNVKTNTYIIAGNTLTIDARWIAHQYVYTISIDNDELTIQYPGQNPVYYKRVK